MDFWAIPPRGPHFARRQRREAGRERLASTDNQLSFPSTAPAGGREEAAAEAASAPAPPAPSPPSSKPRTASPASFITWEKGLARLNSMELKVADVDVVDQGRWVGTVPVVPVDSRTLRVMLIIMMMGRTRGMRAETDEERAKEGCGGGTAMLDLSGGRLTLPPIFPCRHLVKTIPSMAAFLTLNHVLKYIMRTQLGITTFPHTLVRQSPLSVSLSFVRHPLSRFRRTQSKNQQHQISRARENGLTGCLLLFTV